MSNESGRSTDLLSTPGQPGTDSLGTRSLSTQHSALSTLRRWFPRLLAVALLVLALQQAGIENVWRSLLGAHLPSVLLSVALVLPFIVARAARWRTILADLGIGCGLVEASRLYAIGLYIGTVTPGQAGDAVKAWYLSRRGESLALGLLSCFLDRLFDILVLAAIATTALVVFWPSEQRQWTVGAAVIVAGIAALLFLARPGLRARLMGLPGVRWGWTPVERRLRKLAWGPALLDSGLRLPTLAAALAVTVVGFAVTLTRIYLLFSAVGVNLPVLEFLAVASVMVFAGLVSVAGLGSRDVALIALLAPFGYSKEQAVAASFLILFITLTNVVPGVVAALGRPAPVKPAPADA